MSKRICNGFYFRILNYLSKTITLQELEQYAQEFLITFNDVDKELANFISSNYVFIGEKTTTERKFREKLEKRINKDMLKSTRTKVK